MLSHDAKGSCEKKHLWLELPSCWLLSCPSYDFSGASIPIARLPTSWKPNPRLAQMTEAGHRVSFPRRFVMVLWRRARQIKRWTTHQAEQLNTGNTCPWLDIGAHRKELDQPPAAARQGGRLGGTLFRSRSSCLWEVPCDLFSNPLSALLACRCL